MRLYTNLALFVVHLNLVFSLWPQTNQNQNTFRVMTFNTWECGANVDDGLNKIIKHIETVNPDVIALQEINYNTHECYSNITKLLGPKWFGQLRDTTGYPDSALFSRWPIVNGSHIQTDYGEGLTIQYPLTSGHLSITLWSVHFDWSSFGPDAACNKLVTQQMQIMAGELGMDKHPNGRVQNAQRIAYNLVFEQSLVNSDTVPLILMGDFNSPSHLDWVEATKPEHCGWVFNWPASATFAEKGMIDSYRELHPDPDIEPGNTWSTCNKYLPQWGYTVPTPQDRIDFILYKSAKLKPIKSMVYVGDQPIRPIPNQKGNDWPSDHASVVTQFTIIN